MTNQEVIDAIYSKLNIKIDKDDSAFLLVEINRLLLTETCDALLANINQATNELKRERIEHLNQLTLIANQLTKNLTTHNNDIRQLINAHAVDKSVVIEPPLSKKYLNIAFIVIAFLTGCLLTLLIK